jgi:hypothetical protein
MHSSAARACFGYCWEKVDSGIHDLDGDDDRVACESWP